MGHLLSFTIVFLTDKVAYFKKIAVECSFAIFVWLYSGVAIAGHHCHSGDCWPI